MVWTTSTRHRSPGVVISPYARRGGVIHTFYNTISIDRTNEDLLGMDHLGFNDANAPSMEDVFTTQPDLRPYNVLVPGSPCKSPVDPALIPDCKNPAFRARITQAVTPRHTGSWWGGQTKSLSFDRPDENDA